MAVIRTIATFVLICSAHISGLSLLVGCGISAPQHRGPASLQIVSPEYYSRYPTNASNRAGPRSNSTSHSEPTRSIKPGRADRPSNQISGDGSQYQGDFFEGMPGPEVATTTTVISQPQPQPPAVPHGSEELIQWQTKYIEGQLENLRKKLDKHH